jgi:hypothetical protein
VTAAAIVLPRQRVACPCGWVGCRVHPNAHDCPACAGRGEKIQTLWQIGQGPHQSIIYLLHFHWPSGRVDPWHIRLADGSVVKFHADHYSGKTRDFPRRLSEHLAGVYVPGQRGHRGQGARLVAAAVAYGAEVRVARLWHVPLEFERRLKQRGDSESPRSEKGTRRGAWKGLRPLCPEPDCSGDKAWQRFPEAKIQAYYRSQRQAVAAERQALRAARALHEAGIAAGVWNAEAEWDQAFPHLAYGDSAKAAIQV